MKLEHRSGWKKALWSVSVASVCVSVASVCAAPALGRATELTLGGATAPSTNAAAQEPVAAPVRYARAKASGVKMYNLADKKAEVVLTLPADGILAVYSERAGFLEAEAPQSLEVWVYGKFVKTTSDPSLLEATETLLMRPLPSSDEKSYPLAQRLHKGERVRMITRADDKKPFKEDWIKVYAPPGTRAWVQASETVPMASGADALALWASAVKAAQATASAQGVAPSLAASTTEKSAEEAAATKTATKGDALEEAQKMLNAAKASAEPDYAPARAAFQKIVEESPKSSAAEAARVGLDKIEVLEEIERLKHDAKLVEQKRHEELEKANARLHELSLKQDPLWGRFQARGWVEHDAGGHYWIHWSGKNLAEIECKTGRYQLADYAGFEVGVMGVTMRAAIAQNGATESQPPLIDITRIEVISGRMN